MATDSRDPNPEGQTLYEASLECGCVFNLGMMKNSFRVSLTAFEEECLAAVKIRYIEGGPHKCSKTK